MLVLALDTSTAAGSVALVRDGRLLDSRSGDAARTHGERLPGDLTALLAAHGCSTAAVDRYAVCCGPGSFTGLRVGLAAMQGLALTHGRQIVQVPTLEALARAALPVAAGRPRPTLIGAWMNAHRGEVFAALYAAPTDEGVEPLAELAAPVAAGPAAAAEQWRTLLGGDASRVIIIGDAVDATRPVLEQALPGAILRAEAPPLAPIAAGLAAGGRSGTAPHAARPLYVRRPDAELARERA